MVQREQSGEGVIDFFTKLAKRVESEASKIIAKSIPFVNEKDATEAIAGFNPNASETTLSMSKTKYPKSFSRTLISHSGVTDAFMKAVNSLRNRINKQVHPEKKHNAPTPADATEGKRIRL